MRSEPAAEQHGAFPRPAVGMALRRAIGVEARAMRAEPGGVAAAAGECPRAGNAPAAVRSDRLCARAHAPGQHVALAAEHFARDAWFQIAGRHRASGALVHAPGDRGIATGNRLNALDVGRGVKFCAAYRARHEQSEHAGRVHCIQHVWRQFARCIDARCGCGQQRCEVAGPGDVVGRNVRPPRLVHIHGIVPLIVLTGTLYPCLLGAQNGAVGVLPCTATSCRAAALQAIKRSPSFTEFAQSFTELRSTPLCAAKPLIPARRAIRNFSVQLWCTPLKLGVRLIGCFAASIRLTRLDGKSEHAKPDATVLGQLEPRSVRTV